MSNLLHHRYLSVDGHAIRRSLEGIVTKFYVHGLLNQAQELGDLVQKFLTSCDFKGHGTVSLFFINENSFEFTKQSIDVLLFFLL